MRNDLVDLVDLVDRRLTEPTGFSFYLGSAH
jgi:hypothetical protein